MTSAEQRISDALNRAVDRITPDLTEKILKAPAVRIPPRPFFQRFPYRRAAAVAAGIAVAAAAAVTAPSIARFAVPVPSAATGSSAVPASSASVSAAAEVSKPAASAPTVSGKSAAGVPYDPYGGPLLFSYYEYAGNYYSVGAADPAIQKSIGKSLDGNIYRIKGEDPAENLAFFTNRYYRRLIYAFPASAALNGTEYLLAPDNSGFTAVDPKTGKAASRQRGAYLGKAGGFSAYAVSGAAPSERIFVQIGGDDYCIAYAAPACVQYGGKTYWLQAGRLQNVSAVGLKETLLGTSGGYQIYRYGGGDPAYSVMVHISATEEMRANAVRPAAGPPPESLYGSELESMGPGYAQIEWRGHGFYCINDSFSSSAGQSRLAALAGAFLGSTDEYPVYRMKGADPSKAVLAKNGRAWIEYDYIFPDAVTFRGARYVTPQGGDDAVEKAFHVSAVVRGAKIGTAGPYAVYAVKGIDPSKAVFAALHGKTGGTEMSSTVTFVRE